VTRGNLAAGCGKDGRHSGELQQQEVARTAVERRAAEHRNRGAPKEEGKGDFPRDLFVILENCRDLLVKISLITLLELKQKCGQNESCITFQVLQLCFRV
jgi:hypothetical protein